MIEYKLSLSLGLIFSNNLRDKLFEIELQIKLAKLEQNEQKISQLLEEKDKIRKAIFEHKYNELKEGKTK